MAGRYFGGKGEGNIENMFPLFPVDNINQFIDCFFGMGNVSRLVAYGMSNTEVVAYELERSLYTLHEVIKDDHMVEELIDKIKGVENSKEYFQQCLETVKAYNAETKKFGMVDVALAELVIIRFSRDNARNSWRNPESYKGRNYDEWTMTKKRVELEAQIKKFYHQMPAEIMDMHQKWKQITLINDNCMNHMEQWASSENFFFIDPPYLPWKRGLKEKGNKKPVDKGYMEDMSVDQHEELIDKIISISKAGAKCMVCSNFEIDEKGELIGVADDPYTRLMQNGFRMVVVKKKYSTVATHEVHSIEGGKVRQRKKPKVEVVYINYRNIIGNWNFYKYIDYADIVS